MNEVLHGKNTETYRLWMR